MITVHPIPPFFCNDSEILILGSFPSVKSRETGFFYGHAQNRFWKVTASIFGCPVPHTIDEKKEFLRQNKIALWDVIASCEISGSADSTIRNVIPNDPAVILNNAPIKRIFVNGKTAWRYFKKYADCGYSDKAAVLPSTSPANASFSLGRLIGEWSVIRTGGDLVSAASQGFK